MRQDLSALATGSTAVPRRVAHRYTPQKAQPLSYRGNVSHDSVEMSVPLCQRQQLLSDDSHGNDLRPAKGQEKESVRR